MNSSKWKVIYYQTKTDHREWNNIFIKDNNPIREIFAMCNQCRPFTKTLTQDQCSLSAQVEFSTFMTLCRFLDQNESGRQTPNYCLSKIVLTSAEVRFLMEPSGRFPTPASPGNILWCSSTPWTGHLCAEQRLWSSLIDWKISRPAVAKSWQFPWIQNSLLFSGPTPPDHREGWGKFRYLSSQIR